MLPNLAADHLHLDHQIDQRNLCKLPLMAQLQLFQLCRWKEYWIKILPSIAHILLGFAQNVSCFTLLS